jgi:peroxiredoxin
MLGEEPAPMHLGLVLSLSACMPILTSDDTGGVSDWVAPENDWPMSAPPASLEATGYKQGDVPPDFRLLDQHGQEVALWQFYGMVVLLDVSTTWCGPCRVLAADAEETWHDYQDEGFVYLTLLAENESFEVPSQEDLEEWATDYGITAPILADSVGYAYEVEPNSGWPALVLIGRDMVIEVERVTPAEDATVRAAIEAAL